LREMAWSAAIAKLQVIRLLALPRPARRHRRARTTAPRGRGPVEGERPLSALA
jgi:hypothetical protein